MFWPSATATQEICLASSSGSDLFTCHKNEVMFNIFFHYIDWGLYCYTLGWFQFFKFACLKAYKTTIWFHMPRKVFGFTLAEYF